MRGRFLIIRSLSKFIQSNLFILLITVIVSVSFFIFEGHLGFSLWDEGYAWYGAQRVMLGEIPIRDFMAYDPSRYYWSAAIMSLLDNNGIIAFRISIAIFQSLGLFIGLLLIIRSVNTKKENIVYLLLSAIILMLWMLPYYKIFDESSTILLIGTLAFLIEKPTYKRYFLAGFFLGILATFGRNHGMYGVAASIAVMLWLSIQQPERVNFIKKFMLWLIGVVVGYSPILLMLIFVPGFHVAFLDSIRFLFEVKSTNLALPIPWPWQVNFTAALSEVIYGILVGLFFIAIVFFGLISIIYVTVQRFRKKDVSSIVVATSFLALPYAHYAFSRADVAHLALGIFPFLIGVLAFLGTQHTKLKWSFGIILLITSFWVTRFYHSGWQLQDMSQVVHVKISDNNIIVDPNTANEIALIRKLAEQYAPNGQSFVTAPFWPGAYALLERKSPTWEIYALWPRPKAFELVEIERIKAVKPGFIFVLDLPIDGRDELRFKNTHPITNQYILEHYDRIPYTSNKAYQIYTPKQSQISMAN